MIVVLSSKQFARRWRNCYRIQEPPFPNAEEDLWRERNLEHLGKAHTLGGIKDLGFAVVESRYGVSRASFRGHGPSETCS
jgi:hypothetical protein